MAFRSCAHPPAEFENSGQIAVNPVAVPRGLIILAFIFQPGQEPEPFAAVIYCTADTEKVDYRMRSKWSRVLRYAAEFKDLDEPLGDFIKRKGGINGCASRFARHLGRGQHRGAACTLP